MTMSATPLPPGFPGRPKNEKRKLPPWLAFALKVVYACACGLFIAFLWVGLTGVGSSSFGVLKLQAMTFEQQKLPGAAELRSDGCQSVMVSTPAFRAKYPLRRDKSGETWVMCMPLLLRTPPTCDRLARHYVAVAHPAGPFTMSVVGPSVGKSGGCRERFDASGFPILADAGN